MEMKSAAKRQSNLGELTNYQVRAADGDHVFEQRDRQILAAGGSDQSPAGFVAAEGPDERAGESGDGADHGRLRGHAESSSAQGADDDAHRKGGRRFAAGGRGHLIDDGFEDS